MIIEEHDGKEERRILTDLIVSDLVLTRIASKWPKVGGLFRSKYANTIGGWCVGFEHQYGKAPGKAIIGLFENWASKTRDKAVVDSIERILSQLSHKFKRLAKEVNADYSIDRAKKYFDLVHKEKFSDKFSKLIETGELDKADALVNSYSKIEMGLGSTIDIFNDIEAVKRAFQFKRESLVKYPGAAGEFFGSAIERGGFIALWGRYKIGKSVWLHDMLYRAAIQRKRVFMFQAGDMSEFEFAQRVACRASGIPIESGKIRLPTSIEREEVEEGPAEIKVEYKEKIFKHGLNWQDTWRAYEKLRKFKIKSSNPYYNVSIYAAGTLSMSLIRETLKSYEREKDFHPDIIGVDYPDIMDMSGEEGDLRDRTSALWLGLRRLAQELHCCVVVVTQIKASGLKAYLLGPEHFSDDARKLAHVSGVIGINQTTTEEEKGVFRLKWINLRHSRQTKILYVAGSMQLQSPIMVSCF